MAAGNEWEVLFADANARGNAQAIFTHLADLENSDLQKKNLSRWIWELIQNARGTAGSQPELTIEIELRDERLFFRHNGPPFRKDEIVQLIAHGTTKHDPHDLRHFGTGFITTTLISKHVQIRGVLIDDRSFDFPLNREGVSAHAIERAMRDSQEKFIASLDCNAPRVSAPYTTEYSYRLNPSVKAIVDGGINALNRAAPYVFAFNPMLRRISIVTDEGPSPITGEPLNSPYPGITMMRIRSEGHNSEQQVVIAGDEEIVAAMIIEVDNGEKTVQLPEGVPKLFVAFPLNGTEGLCIPLVLNSERFTPKPERDGVYLGTGTSPDNEQNKALFAKGCGYILELISLAAEQSWRNAPKLAVLQPIGPFKDKEWVNKDWLKSLIRSNLIRGLRTSGLLRTISGELVRPETACIPVSCAEASSLDLWEALKHLADVGDHLPRLEDQEAWGVAAKSWTAFFEDSEEKPGELWTVDRLVDHLAGLRTMNNIAEALLPGICPIKWVKIVHDVICKAGRFETFHTKPLIPNQRGDLTVLDRLYGDGNIDDELKHIGHLLGVRVQDELVDRDIDTPEIVNALKVRTRTEDEVLTNLLETLRQRVRNKRWDDDLWAGSDRLFAWLLNRGKTERLDGFPFLTIRPPDEKNWIKELSSRGNAEERYLAPVSLWPEAARPYKELFPEDAIMAQRYATACSDVAAWQRFAHDGFIHLAPLYTDESIVRRFFPDEPLPVDEQKPLPRSERAVPRTELAWLTKGDRSVINRVRGSRARAVKLLRFCFEYVIPYDPQAFDEENVLCDNGKPHRYYRADWISPLRMDEWVPMGEGKNVANVTPSAESLAKLLVEDRDLLQSLAMDHTSFLEALGVSPADLALRLLGRDDHERASLLQSLAVITIAADNDPIRVQKLANAIEKDPKVFKIVEDWSVRRERVARNQALGDLAERLFKEAVLSSDLEESSKLAVHRTGPGHDYRVEALPEEEEEDLAHLRITEGGRSVFVEVKATTGDKVGMSKRQVGEAVLNKDHYFLCVLRVADDTIDAETFKEQVKFVVDIGGQLEHLWNEYCSMQNVLSEFETHEGGLTVVMTGQDVRFSVSEPVWSDGKDFMAAIELLREYLVV